MRLLTLAACAASFLTCSGAFAGSILIINGSSTTSEPDTTASITTQLQNFHGAAGNTVTVVDGVPASFAGFQQIWDIRFSNSSPITADVRAQYLSFLQAGGGLFVMGENEFFTTRNISVLSLIAGATGDSLTFVVPNSTQTVLPPFTGPNTIPDGNVTYLAPGGVTTPGTSGQFITRDASNRGTGVAWGVGKMAFAPAGALTVIFDVNFMQTSAETDSQTLLRNLINFVDVQTQIPEPSSFSLIGVGLAIAGLIARRRAARP